MVAGLSTDWQVWLYSFPLIYVIGCASWYVQIVMMNWLRVQMPDIKQTGLRLTVLGVSHFCIRSIAFIFIFYLYDAIHFLGYELEIEKVKFAIYFSLALTLMATSMWEADFTFKQWKSAIVEKGRLKQLTIQQEFEALKGPGQSALSVQLFQHLIFSYFRRQETGGSFFR